MSFTNLTLSMDRQVTLCGTNVYPTPEIHPDRVMPAEHDLCYFYSGEQGIAQEGEQYTLQAGDLIFLRAGDHHYGTFPTTPGTRSMFIHFNRLPGDGNCLAPGGDTDARNAPFCLPTVLHIGQNNKASQLFNEIIATHWSHDAAKNRRCTLLLNLLLDELSAITLADQSSGRDEWSVSVINLFQRHPGRMYSLEEVADIVGMNVRTLSTRFRQITGQSIHQYQLNFKLELAYKQLRTGSCTVKDAALSLGFCDAYYFSRQFKKKFGVSPKEIKSRDPSANINRHPVV